MTETAITPGADFDLLYRQLSALLLPDDGPLTNMANAASFLYWSVNDLNWVGFYMAGNSGTQDAELRLGPFQGKPACTRIKYGQGVCGTAALTLETQNVPDVNAFPGHIPCDSASASELVIPVEVNSELYAVLDIDSPICSRFDPRTEEFFQKCSQLLGSMLGNAEIRA